MYPKTEQEIIDLLRTGQITEQEAQMYRAQLNSTYQNPFGSITSTPDWATSQQPVTSGQPVKKAMFNGVDLSMLPVLSPQSANVQTGDPATLSLNDAPTREQYVEQQNRLGYDPTTAGEDWDEIYGVNSGKNTQTRNPNNFPVLFPGGSDLSTELYSLGRNIGAPKGSTGRVAGIVGSAGAAAFDIARNVASGIGFEKMNRYVDDWYRQQQFGGENSNYVAAPQYQNTNYLGGFYGEDGGSPQESNPQAMQQVAAQIAQALQQGQSPQAIIQLLMEQGIPQQQAQQLVASVVQQMQQVSQQSRSVEEQQEISNLESVQPQEQNLPMMKNGGVFKHKVGDEISFKLKGETVTGVIKKIENGKIYL